MAKPSRWRWPRRDTGFRSKTRFAKFFNLPELMSMWREAADIQTAEMLKLPVPEADKITVVTKPSDFQAGDGWRIWANGPIW